MPVSFCSCFARPRTHLRFSVGADLQKLLWRKGFVYRTAKRLRYCGSAEIYREICADLEIIFILSAAHRIPRPLLCRISSARYTRLDLLATRDIASRKTVINRFSLALHPCLALAVNKHLITLVVLLGKIICSPANIPHSRNAPIY